MGKRGRVRLFFLLLAAVAAGWLVREVRLLREPAALTVPACDIAVDCRRVLLATSERLQSIVDRPGPGRLVRALYPGPCGTGLSGSVEYCPRGHRHRGRSALPLPVCDHRLERLRHPSQVRASACRGPVPVYLRSRRAGV